MCFVLTALRHLRSVCSKSVGTVGPSFAARRRWRALVCRWGSALWCLGESSTGSKASIRAVFRLGTPQDLTGLPRLQHLMLMGTTAFFVLGWIALNMVASELQQDHARLRRARAHRRKHVRAC